MQSRSTPGGTPVDYLLIAEGRGPGGSVVGAGGLAALAAECETSAEELRELLALAAGRAPRKGGEPEDETTRLALRTTRGPRLVVAARLPAAEAGPGAPHDSARYFEAGLRLGAGGRGASDGPARIWIESEGGAPHDSLRDALWRGLSLGLQRVEQRGEESGDEAAPRPVFADGGATSQLTIARAEAAAWVRRMVERPANLLGPAEFTAEIIDLVKQASGGGGPEVRLEVWSLEDARDRGFGAVAAVGGGSNRPPAVVRLSWGDERASGEEVLGLIGKGITFDSGGINLKRDPGELAWMKSDMAAAAAIASALVLASRHPGRGDGPSPTRSGSAPRRVEAILPICDNAVSGGSMRPGDVVAHPDGSTTEIVDTDCEGRLVLADGIAWCRQQGYGSVLDVGTLTDGGAGLRRVGLWSNDAGFADRLRELGEAVADGLWPLPLPYGEAGALESRVADRCNAPMDRPDLGQHAALYLSGFAAGARWAHFDIGGVAYLEHPTAGWPEGATGAATVALAEAMGAWMSADAQLSQ